MQQRGLAGAVWTNDADAVSGCGTIRHVHEEWSSANANADVHGVDDLAAKKTVANLDLDGALFGGSLRSLHLGYPVDATLLLGTSGLGAFLQPGEFATQLVALVFCGGFLDGKHGLFPFEVLFIAPFETEHAVLVELQNAGADGVKEVAVVRDQEQTLSGGLQFVLQPLYRIGIKVVRGLVQDEQVRLGDQGACKSDAFALSARHGMHASVHVMDAQLAKHDGCAGLDFPRLIGVMRRTIGIAHRDERRVIDVKLRLLLEVYNATAAHHRDRSLIGLIDAGHDA